MKKVCLITYTGSPNYGAALQLYATYHTLRNMDCDVSVINYQNNFESNKKLKYFFSNASIKDKAREFLGSYIFGVKKNAHQNFDDFYRQMKYTSFIHSINEIDTIGKFDVFCVGSDQVWNPRITNGYDDVFILNSTLKSRKISYASSMGSCNYREYSEEKFISSIDKFDKISVREKIARDYICSRISKSVKQVVDPTLLVGIDGWNEIINKNHMNYLPTDKYVLIYALGGYFEKNRVIAEKVAKKLGAKIYAITLSNRKKNVDRVITDATPIDFVRLIRDASFVVTNSFHGTCFSMLMKTPFYSVRFGDNPARAEELLETFGLQNRLFREDSVLDERLFSNDDIEDATLEIKKCVDESVLWLEQAING